MNAKLVDWIFDEFQFGLLCIMNAMDAPANEVGSFSDNWMKA